MCRLYVKGAHNALFLLPSHNVITVHVHCTMCLMYVDYAENGSLQDFISNRPCSPDLERALPWAKQIAEGERYSNLDLF